MPTLIIPEYVEMAFSMPFYEMYFPDTWNDNNLPRNPFELRDICDALQITLDTNFLFEAYDLTSIGKGDIYIFYAKGTKSVFIYFDLLKDKYDQMAMVVLGVRVRMDDREKIREKLWALYFKSTTRTNFQEDYFNKHLWRIATDYIPIENRKVHHIEG